jgi:hypothetical protein
MEKYKFIIAYIEGLPGSARHNPEYPYALREGLGIDEARQLAHASNFPIPSELQDFYAFSYGASLGEYSILTVNEIASLTREMQATYEEAWIDTMLPFAYVRDLGNVIVFDLSEMDSQGRYSIKDAFHELAPPQWERICYGMKTWLCKMVNHHFEPFWLDGPTS